MFLSRCGSRLLLGTVVFSTAFAYSGLALAGSWVVQNDTSTTILLGVDFLNTQTGYYAGADSNGGVIFRTDNGGQTWASQVRQTQVGSYMDVSLGDTDRALAGGLGMWYVLAGASFTEDGHTWQPSKDRWLAVAWQDVEAIDASHMFMVGEWVTARDYGDGIARSDDGGKTFEYLDWGVDTPARYGSFLGPLTGYVSGGQWPDDSLARLGRGRHRLSQHLMLPVDSAQLMKPTTDGYRGVIARTSDGGESWEILYDDVGRFYFNGIDFIDELNGWAVAEGAEGAYIVHTADGGRTWNEQLFEPGASLMQVRMIDENEGWAGGGILGASVQTLFLHTTDGGLTWTRYQTADKYYVLNLDVIDSEHAWAVAYGANGLCSLVKYEP